MHLLTFINKLEQKKYLFLLILFAATLLCRLPTLFNDFYDVDELAAIVQTHEYMAGDVPGKDFTESKLPLYHAIFKAAYFLMPQNGWVLVHVFTVFIIFLTAIFIYSTGDKINGFKTGALASLLYAVLISSFNRHFMATNGEIVYNLPVSAGFYFFILFLDEQYKTGKRFIFLCLSTVMGVCAAYVKFHGLIFFIFMAFMLIIYVPYYKKKFTLKYFSALLSVIAALISLSVLDYFVTHIFAQRLLTDAAGKLTYSSVQGFSPLVFSAKYIHRQLMLSLWHFAVWISAFVFLFLFIKNKFRNESLLVSASAVLFIITYLLIFAGGSRLYFHYFISVYPALCITGAYSLNEVNFPAIKKIKDKITILILIPTVFFIAWNTKDILIKHYFQQAFYNEGRTMYWMRAALIGTFNDYLLPEASYKDACAYIRTITKPGDRIFVWGDGPYLYYFSGRRMGINHLWPKTTIFVISSLYDKADNDSIKNAEAMENDFINNMRLKKPVLFADTSGNGLSTFHYKPTPKIEKYIKDNYYFTDEIQKIKIYKIKE
ncbi:MAG: hypothetical protein V1874_09985 [Spirochaetota bacterium]